MNSNPPEPSEPTGEQLPANIEAEQQLIGAILRYPSDLLSVDVEPDDFYVLRNRQIWEAMKAIQARTGSFDAFSVAEEITKGCADPEQRRHDIRYVYGLEGGVIGSFGFSIHEPARLIRDAAARRRLVLLASDLVQSAYDAGADIQDTTARLMLRLSDNLRTGEGAEHWSKHLDALYDDVERRAANPQDVWGLQTGFPKIDRLTGGLQQGELLIMSGKPSMGKSMFAMQMGEQLAACNPGAIYSIEMKSDQVARRIVSASSGVRTRAMKSGRLGDKDWPNIISAIERLRTLPVFLADPSGLKTSALQADLSRLKAKHGIKWFVFDYLLLAGDAPEAEEWERAGMLSRSFKLICRNLDLAGVVIHSMNQAGLKPGVPDMSHLRGSVQVSFDADVVAILTDFQTIRPGDNDYSDDEKKNLRTLFFTKGRDIDDPDKYVHLVKNPNFPTFRELADRKDYNAQRP